MTKLIVVGLDGATFTLINRLIKNLPNFKRIMQQGSYGIVKSVMPPGSIPAWPALLTGKNPGRFGVFNFIDLKKKNYQIKITNAKDVKQKKIWNYLNQANKKCAYINIPSTYPAEPIKGFIIAGNLAPNVNSPGFLFPKHLKLPKGYKIEPSHYFSVTKQQFAKEAFELFDLREKLAKNLLTKNLDMLFCCFMLSDLTQHYFWKDLDEKTKDKDILLKVYQKFDDFIGYCLKNYPNYNLIVLSDHGFCRLEGNFNLNDWLVKEGYLVLKRKKRLDILKKIGVTKENAFKLLQLFKLEFLVRKIPLKLRKSLPDEGATDIESVEIDWSRTKAFSKGEHDKIYINTAGHRPQGIVKQTELNSLINEITNKLLKLKHGKKKLDVVVKKKKDLFYGPYTENAPEIIFKINEHRYFIQKKIGHKTIFECLGERNASHDEDGIFILTGKDIKKNFKITNMTIYDILPTILYLMNLPVPDDLDGNVRAEIFTKISKVKYTKEDYEKDKITAAIKNIKI